jgi:predicted metal-dependent phosphoesterase TrpH
VENSNQSDPIRKAGAMIVKARPLLCELHAHTRWSDGTLTLAELVDLYGSNGFDVLVVSDHVIRSDDPWPAENPDGSWICESNFTAYLEAVQAEAERARATYDLLVIPGVELTYNDPEPDLAGHAVAVGLRTFVSVDGGLAEAMSEARASDAAIIAAHPHSPDHGLSDRATRRIFREWRVLGGLIDRFELFNQREVFSWVANAGLPSLASGDFHRAEHLSSWKTLIPCEKREAEVVSYLRTSRPVYITRLERAVEEQQAAA